MIKVRIEEKPAFKIIGSKTWISGTDNELFNQFWQKCEEKGLLEIFKVVRGNQPGLVTNSLMMGVSCVENDPNNRSFNFYIAIEFDTEVNVGELIKNRNHYLLEEYLVPASKWAIFQNQGRLPDSLVESEMYAFRDWLPKSKYLHANVPEIEVYPPYQGSKENILNEFWMPIIEK